MSRLIITGAGHSGTNLVLEILRAHGKWDIHPKDGLTEDRVILSKLQRFGLSDDYLTKLCTENKPINRTGLETLMNYDFDMQFVFCVRSPIDCALARIYKYYPINGEDALKVIEHLEYAADILDLIMEKWPYALTVVPMNFLLKGFEESAKMIIYNVDQKSKKEDIKPEVFEAYQNVLVKDKKEKYKGKLDKRRANILEYEEELFGDFWEDPFYKEQKSMILKYFGDDLEVWKDRPSYEFWKRSMEV